MAEPIVNVMPDLISSVASALMYDLPKEEVWVWLTVDQGLCDYEAFCTAKAGEMLCKSRMATWVPT